MGRKIKVRKSKAGMSPSQAANHAGTAGPNSHAVNVGPKTPEPKNNADRVLDADGLGDLISQAENTESEARGFMEPAATVTKRPRGRPKGSGNASKNDQASAGNGSSAGGGGQEGVPPGPPPFDCRPAFQKVFGITSAWLVRYVDDSRMGLLPEEIQELGNAWGAIANKYAPSMLSAYGEEITAIMVTGAIAARLYQVSGQILAEREAQAKSRMQSYTKAERPHEDSSITVN